MDRVETLTELVEGNVMRTILRQLPLDTDTVGLLKTLQVLDPGVTRLPKEVTENGQ